MQTTSRLLTTLFQDGALGNLTDGGLLEQFVANRSEAAFALLVERHGPMVWSVCRRVLGDHHDAEDAFQAAFLVLAQKAASVEPRESVGNWLYGVASRTALKSKARSARRRVKERHIPRSSTVGSDLGEARWELAAILDEELGRLPGRFRAAIVICDLEGRTRCEAARELGWREGTVASRLSRGRALLTSRLTRRGVVFSAGALALEIAKEAGASLPERLMTQTARAASLLAIGQAPVGLISSHALSLADGAIEVAALKKTLAVVTLFAMVLGGGGISYLALASEPPEGRATKPVAGAPGPDPSQPQAEVRAMPELSGVLERVIESVPSIEDLDYRVWLLCEVARVQGEAGLDEARRTTLRKAVQAADDAESDHRRLDVATALAAAGQLREAFELIRRIGHDATREQALSHVVGAQARAGALDGAVRTVAALKARRFKGEALRAIAEARAERQDFTGALATAATIAETHDRALALTAVAVSQLRAKHPSAEQTLDQARKAANSIPARLGADVRPGDSNAPALAELAGALATFGALDEARNVARSITKAPWGEIATKNIVEALLERGEIDEALTIAESTPAGDDKASALERVVEALVRSNDLARARRVAETIEPGSGLVAALLVVAKEQVRRGQAQEAARIFNRVRLLADELKDDRRGGNRKPAALSRLARVQAEIGEHQAALRWIEGLSDTNARAWALFGLAQGLVDRHPLRPKPPAAADADRPVDDALIAKALNGNPPAAAPPLRKPSKTFKGKLILFGFRESGQREGTGIAAINPDGTGLERVLPMGPDEWMESGRESPDGTRLAFSLKRGRTGPSELWILDAEGTRRKLVDNQHVVAWSPDGKRLATCHFTTNREIENAIVDVETARVEPLPLPRHDLVDDWSPDGEDLAVMAGNLDSVFKHPTKGTYPLRQIDLMKRDGSGRRILTPGAMLDSIDARFSPDGKWLMYHQRRHADGRVLHFAVLQGREQGEPRDLVNFNDLNKGYLEYRSHGEPAWSPDGTAVAWLVTLKKSQFSAMKLDLTIVSVPEGRVEKVHLAPLGVDWVQAIDWR